jgi:two-component system, LytTR family, sensor kinase
VHDVPRWLRFWPLHLAGWGAFYVCSVLSAMAWWEASVALPDRALMTVLGLGLSSGLWVLYRRVPPEPLARRVLVAVAASVVAGVLWTLLHTLTILWLTGERTPWLYVRHAPRKMLGGAPLAVAVLLAWSALYLFLTAWKRQQQAQARALRAEALAVQARLDALRYQLDPHFLFNTLNALATLVAEGRTDEAGRTITRLSAYLRRTLDTEGHADLPLRDELAATRDYLAVEAVRFGPRLRVEEAITPEASAVPVPALLLQPLVENALRHGLARREGGGALHLRAWQEAGALCVEVANDVPEGAALGREGIGLRNVRARLAARYGPAARLSCALDAGRAVVRVTLPV